TIENIFGIIVRISPDRIGYRSSCLIDKIGRYTVPAGKYIIGNDTHIVRLIVVARKIFAIIYPFLGIRTVHFYKGTGIGIAYPAIEPSAFAQQQFHTICLALPLQDLGFYRFV